MIFSDMYPLRKLILLPVILAGMIGALVSCADATAPGARNANIPPPVTAEERKNAVNEVPDSVVYLPLGSDVLVPDAVSGTQLPDEEIGPFELRSETLAGALQLILADYEIPLAFETEEGLNRTITVTNLRGPLNRVVDKVCGLADLYCSYEDGLLVIKDTQVFTVSVPPVGGDTDMMDALSTGLEAITGNAPIAESGTRTIIYEATNRTANLAERYFQRLRASTALIIFEVYIWEVSLDTVNSTGINWSKMQSFGKYNMSFDFPGSTDADLTNPVTIGLPTVNGDVSEDVVRFLSTYGAVKTISQPQITVLSGSEATLRAADTDNFVTSLSRTIEGDETTVSTETSEVDSGFTLTITSSWDKATVYGTIEINLQELRGFDEITADGTQLKLPQTTERELSTQIRIRPGDSLLIGGLVKESDGLDKSGPGFEGPIIPTSRTTEISNSELVFLMKPRVVVYTSEGDVQPPESYGRKAKKSGNYPRGSLSTEMLDPSL